MSLNRQEKSVVIDEISAEVSKAGSIIIAEYRGLDVSSATVLRKNAREAGVYLRVLKNTLAIRALKGTAFEGISEHLKGPLIYAISEDSVAPAKVLHQFSKQNPNLIIVAGALPNSVMGAKDVEALASLPSRDELIAKLMGTMQAPVSQFVRTLNEVPTKFVRGLAAVRDKQSA